MRKRHLLAATLFAAVLAAIAGGTGAAAPAASQPLVVGATAVPHAEILRFVARTLAPKAGLKLKIVEFSDYVQPNVALAEKELDANYFQHRPYLDDQIAQRGYKFAVVTAVHVEPLGIYSKKLESLAALGKGATVAIPNDVTNGGRALRLLAARKLITLRPGAGISASVRDIASNPKSLKVVELEAAQLPRSLDDVDLAVINGNYALAARLVPARDALALERAKGNIYANVLVSRQDNRSDPRLRTLARLLHSEQVKAFIARTYRGSVIPAP